MGRCLFSSSSAGCAGHGRWRKVLIFRSETASSLGCKSVDARLGLERQRRDRRGGGSQSCASERGEMEGYEVARAAARLRGYQLRVLVVFVGFVECIVVAWSWYLEVRHSNIGPYLTGARFSSHLLPIPTSTSTSTSTPTPTPTLAQHHVKAQDGLICKRLDQPLGFRRAADGRAQVWTRMHQQGLAAPFKIELTMSMAARQL